MNESKPITSFINKLEAVTNTQRKFGANVKYYPCYINDSDSIKFALFTERELDGAILRGVANPEDMVLSVHSKSNTDIIVQKIKDLLFLKIW